MHELSGLLLLQVSWRWQGRGEWPWQEILGWTADILADIKAGESCYRKDTLRAAQPPCIIRLPQPDSLCIPHPLLGGMEIMIDVVKRREFQISIGLSIRGPISAQIILQLSTEGRLLTHIGNAN